MLRSSMFTQGHGTHQTIESICTAMQDNPPSYQLVMAVDMPEVVGIRDDVNTTVYCCVIPNNLTKCVNTPKRFRHSSPLHAVTRLAKESLDVASPRVRFRLLVCANESVEFVVRYPRIRRALYVVQLKLFPKSMSMDAKEFCKSRYVQLPM